MTLVQLEYIIAVDTYKSFLKASENCFVTQPTLSMQIQKLEDFLGVQIFDRSTYPITTTEIGLQIITQARNTLRESGRIKELITNQLQEIEGTLKIGIIPTIAPYLLPEIISEMIKNFPKLKLSVWEHTTSDIIKLLKTGILDCGILATPLEDDQIVEIPIYYESFVSYISKSNPLSKKRNINTEDLLDEHLWLLNEGHCMRAQALNICGISKLKDQGLEYNSGSIETLIKMVDLNEGITLLPELAMNELNKKQLNKVRKFKAPEPAREISLVTHKNFIKKRMLNALKDEILKTIPAHMKLNKKKNILNPE